MYRRTCSNMSTTNSTLSLLLPPCRLRNTYPSLNPPAVGTLLNLGPDCANCTAHAGAVQAYLEVKETTNDFAAEKEMVNSTGHQFSVTGHGFGGMLSIIASLDQGWRGQIKWSHNHGCVSVCVCLWLSGSI